MDKESYVEVPRKPESDWMILIKAPVMLVTFMIASAIIIGTGVIAGFIVTFIIGYVMYGISGDENLVAGVAPYTMSLPLIIVVILLFNLVYAAIVEPVYRWWLNKPRLVPIED